MSILNKYMEENVIPGQYSQRIRRLECNDGFTMSVQAGEYLYSIPRMDDAFPYVQVEVGFPSEAPTEFTSYAEDPDDLTGTVYGYVPVSKVEAEIEKHGGIKGPQEQKAIAK